jgi:hypothetical protein
VKRRRTLLILSLCLLLGLLTGLMWLSGPSPVIVNARTNYAKLRLGMSAAEFESALSAPPSYKGKLYGEWYADGHGYATMFPKDCPKPNPSQRLYDWYQWNFSHTGLWASESFSIGALLDNGHVVAFWYCDERENVAGRGLKQLGWQLPIGNSVLSYQQTGGDAAEPRESP